MDAALKLLRVDLDLERRLTEEEITRLVGKLAGLDSAIVKLDRRASMLESEPGYDEEL